MSDILHSTLFVLSISVWAVVAIYVSWVIGSHFIKMPERMLTILLGNKASEAIGFEAREVSEKESN